MAVDISIYEDALELVFGKDKYYDRIMKDIEDDVDKRGLTSEQALPMLTQARVEIFSATLSFATNAINNYKSEATLDYEEQLAEAMARKVNAEAQLLEDEEDRKMDADREATARADEAENLAKLRLENRDLIRHQKTLVTREIAGYDAEVSLKMLESAGGNLRFAIQSDFTGTQDQIDDYNDLSLYTKGFSEFGNEIEDYADGN